MYKETLQYMLSRIIENAKEAAEEFNADKKNDFKSGRSFAYYEVLSMIQNDLSADGEDLSEYGLDVTLENMYE